MNILPYEVKRVHWSMNTAARNEFARIGKEDDVPELKWMTPGRYDVLHVMAEYKWWLREPGRRSMPTMPLPMADLILLLGLHPSTVSRTVSMMVTRELVRKYRNPDDEREVLIVFRKEGWAALRADAPSSAGGRRTSCGRSSGSGSARSASRTRSIRCARCRTS